MSSLKNASPIRGFASLVAAALPLLCVTQASAGEPARAPKATTSEAPQVYLEAGDALGLEIFSRDFPKSETAARAARPAKPTAPAKGHLAGEAMPAAPDLSAPVSR